MKNMRISHWGWEWNTLVIIFYCVQDAKKLPTYWVFYSSFFFLYFVGRYVDQWGDKGVSRSARDVAWGKEQFGLFVIWHLLHIYLLFIWGLMYLWLCIVIKVVGFQTLLHGLVYFIHNDSDICLHIFTQCMWINNIMFLFRYWFGGNFRLACLFGSLFWV